MLARRSSAKASSERLRERRRKTRRLVQALLAVLALGVFGVGVWGTWQPEVRIGSVLLTPGSSEHQATVAEELRGAYLFGLVPHNSVFFVPKRAIRAAVLESDPSIQAVSIRRQGFTGLEVALHTRTPVARWCGEASSVDTAAACYFFDADGFIYEAAETSSSTPLHSFALFSPLSAGTEPLRNTLTHHEALPNLFDFARKLADVGGVVRAIALSGDEATLEFASGTRLIYVLGTEEATYTDLVSAGNHLNLESGTLEYLDLRFPGKVYLKKKSDSVSQ